MRHRGRGQRRIPAQGRAVFVSTVTYRRYPYFGNEILCKLLVDDLLFTTGLKRIELYGYSILPDHLHLMFMPPQEFSYSEVIRSLKTNFARNANDIILNRLGRPAFPAGDVTSRRLRGYELHLRDTLPLLLRALHETCGLKHGIPRSRWQKSFHDHIIRNEHDFHAHLNYIWCNAVKHGFVRKPEDWRWMWVQGMPPIAV